MAEKVMSSIDLQSYTENLTHSLNSFRKSQEFVDVTLVVEGKKFHAHRNVLAASSTYFKKLFSTKEKKQKKGKEAVFVLTDVALDVVDDLLDYLYTGVVELSVINVEGLIKASNMLLLPRLKSKGCKFLVASLNLDKSISTFCFADCNGCPDLKTTAQQFINQNFKDISRSDHFLEMSLNQIEEIVSNDEIVVDREEEVYEAILSWIKHEIKTRNQDFPRLFCHVRLTSMSKYYLHTHIGGEELVKTNRECIELLLEAMKCLSLACNQGGTPRIKPRKSLRRQLLDAVFVCGGLYDNKESCASCTCYVPSKESWHRLEGIDKRWAHGMAEIEGFVYVAGGFLDDSKQDATSSVSRFDLKTNTWAHVSQLCRGTSLPAVAVHGGCLYVMGGTDNNTLRDTQRYCPDTNTWDNLPAMSTGRCAACAAADDRFIYVFGGMQENGDFLDSAEKYNPATDTWTPLPKIPSVRAFACAGAIVDKIYVVGGSTDVLGTNALSSCEVFDTQAEQWSTASSMSVPRFAAGLAVLQDKLYVFGGGQASETFSTIERYSTNKDEWNMVGEMPRSIAHLQCCAVSISNDVLRSTQRLK